MLKFHRVAKRMVKDYDELLLMVEENNGKIPAKKFGRIYDCNASTVHALFIGIRAVRKTLNKKDI